MSSHPLPTPPAANGGSRRTFFRDSGLLFASGAIGGQGVGSLRLEHAAAAHVYGSDQIKVGLIGCGGRGTAAADQVLSTGGGEVCVTALGDVFEKNVQATYRSLNGKHRGRVLDTRFVGLDAYQDVLAADVDVVLLATPPGFRPLHFEAAILAGKHVFMEKPVAVDAPGIRRVLEAGQLATSKSLAVQVGFQRRHDPRYQDCVKQLQSGAIGDFVYARAYWNAAGMWNRPRRKEQTELEYQLTNWYYFNWLSGDHITEQHVHNLDVIHWVLDELPLEAQGQGGRETRRSANVGQIFDHHMVEYVYPSGVRLLSQCRQMPGCSLEVGEHLHGTDGFCDLSKAKIYARDGRLIWESDVETIQGQAWQLEQDHFIAALRRGDRPQETEAAAMSTMMAIMGRMATYSGKRVRWDEALQSNLRLADVDSLHSLADVAPARLGTDGNYEVPVPGKTRVL